MIFESAHLGVFVIAVTMSFVISLFYKLFMDQEKLKEIKDKMNELQEKRKEAQADGNEEKAMEYTEEVMTHSKDQMKMQFKPMIATFIVIIPIFWFVFPTLYPSATATVNQTATLEYRGVEKPVSIQNKDPLEVKVGEKVLEKNDVVKINGYRLKLTKYKESNGHLELSRVAVKLPVSLPFWGNALGWLGWYIIISIGFSQVFRKLLGARP